MKMMVSAILEGQSVQQAFRFALAELDTHFPREQFTSAIEMDEYDPQILADYKLAPKFGINQWLSRELVIRAAIGRYYESGVGFEHREHLAQAMYEALAHCKWSSPYTRVCHEVAAEYDLNVMKMQ